MIESALDNIDNLEPACIASVIAAAIALGQPTLLKYRDIYKKLTHETQGTTIKCLAKLLKKPFAFDELYSTWLATNFKYLQDGSVKLLADLNPADHGCVFYSTVVSLTEEAEFSRFRTIVAGITFQMHASRRIVLENAVRMTQEEETVLPLRKFRDVV